MQKTVAGLVTPHLLRVTDVATQAAAGVNVDWHLREVVGRTVDALAQQANAEQLLAAYIEGLEGAAQAAGPGRVLYRGAIKAAVGIARTLAESRLR